MYRLMNGMYGVPIEGKVIGAAAREVCELTGRAIEYWLAAQTVGSGMINATALDELTDAVWALLHGMRASISAAPRDSIQNR